MHNAPAVSFPVGRSRFQAWFLSAAWLAGAAACACWASMADAVGWRNGLALAMPLGAGAAAWAHWRRAAVGALRWDGQCWRLETPGPTPAPTRAATPNLSPTGALAVRLDFQRFMLLSLRLEYSDVRWVWVDQCADLRLWQAFRRAVYSPAAGNGRSSTPSNVDGDGALAASGPAPKATA